MTYSTSEEEYTFKVTLVFWKFYEIGKYFELPKLRRFLEQEGSFKLYDKYHCQLSHPVTGEKCYQPLKWISSQSHNYAPVCYKIGKSAISLALGDVFGDSLPGIGIIQIVVALSIVVIAIILLRLQERKL